MRRIAEVTLGVIGAVFYLISLFFGFIRIWAENNKGYIQDIMLNNPEEFPLTPAEVDVVENIFNIDLARGGTLLIILPIVAIILGIIAMVLIKGNKQPVAAGIIFIATGVLYVILTVGGGILSGILYLIAGILCLARKPKQQLEN
ncbi:DUF4064 domain-containing protein [Ornithinibacillus scapharcae]|uniref:DUF4064 domain-containing protein n=1 Tax=Ornithinibacillus scapharcae TaxID=1147159 RepID=UPI000225BE5D|nr:DUF4064 domain-containing protein [Ornithinibacillus scapharcae]